ncbi:hypothetical protein [Sphingobium ummariense]
MDRIEDVRAAVADELEARGLSNLRFIEEIRAGERDDGPYMIGALAWMRRDQDVAA